MQLLIKGYSFDLSAPYREGHSLTVGEAKALNDLRKENIQNNFRQNVADQISRLAPGQLLPQAVLSGLQAKLTEYDEKYQFAEKSSRARTGDIELEARAIARERVNTTMYELGTLLPLDELDEMVKTQSQLPSVLEEARSRVAARRSALSAGLDSL